MKFIYFILIILAANLYAEISLPLEYKQQDFDVKHYKVYSDLTSNDLNIKGYSEITIAWNSFDQDRTFYFHAEKLSIDSIFYNGVQFSNFNMTENYYYISNKESYTEDISVIKIYFHGEMSSEGGSFDWGGVHEQNDILYHLGVAFYDPFVSMTNRWFPCYDHPSDKATYQFIFETEPDLTVASNGWLEDTYIDEFNKKITIFSSDREIATYLMTFAVSDYIILGLPYSKHPIQIYTKKADSAASQYSYQNVPMMITAYENYFGEYPFKKIGYVNTPLGAMEHQTMISMPVSVVKNAYNSQNPNVSTIAHELAHQWFGDCVTPLDYKHVWLTESFSTYAESLYEEYLDGYGEYINNQYSKMMSYVKILSKNEGLLPLYNYSRDVPSSNYPQTVYQKGAVVLGMLRYELGDSLFFTSLKEYISRKKYGNSTTEEIKEIFEEISGKNLDIFWQQWIYSEYFPVVNFKINHESNQVRVITEQIQNGDIFTELPVEMMFNDSISKIIRIEAQKDTFYFDDFIYNSVEINKRNNLVTLTDINQIDIETSVIEIKNEINITLSPNPAEEYIEISMNKPSEGSDIEIYDVLGEKIISVETRHALSLQRINISHLPNGVYFVKIGNITEKFVKM